MAKTKSAIPQAEQKLISKELWFIEQWRRWNNQHIMIASRAAILSIIYIYIFDVRWCPVYVLVSFVHVRNRMFKNMQWSSTRPFSICFVWYLYITCPVLMRFISIHIPWSSICAPQWQITNGHVIDKTTDKTDIYCKVSHVVWSALRTTTG